MIPPINPDPPVVSIDAPDAPDNSATILIVDDMPANLETLFTLLQGHGFRILVAEDGQSALHKATYAKPDIILLDVLMPGIDGFETCRHLKQSEKTKNIPVMFMTALSDTPYSVHGFKLGAVDYITKPIRQDDVLTRIRSQLARTKTESTLKNSAEKAKSEFLSSMSHEFRTPLNAILGFAQLLEIDKKNPLSENQKNYVNYIIKGGKHLVLLVQNILDLANMAAGQMTLDTTLFSLDDFFAECLPVMQALAKEYNVTLEQEENEAVNIRADQTRTKQVFFNLVSNAIKYNQKNGLVQIKTSVHNSYLRITVTDNGCGIAEDQQDNLFQPFSRLGAENGEVEGAGIGLALSRHCIHQMQGHIGYIPESQGSTFWFELPITQV